MTKVELGKLVQVSLREVWKHEALDFTQWLALPENLVYLGETIGVDLVDAETEKDVGKFRVDILAKDEVGRRIVVENQLEPTNHDHLGKIITYAAGLEAEVIVWIVEQAREEHEQAITWLNEHTTGDANFFLLQIEAWKIGDSKPAPRFNIIAKPNDWAKTVKQTATGGAASELQAQQQLFYERVRDHGLAHAKYIKSWPKPAPQHWYDISVGSSQAHIGLTVNSKLKQVAAELYINDNKDLFAKLYGQKDDVEAELDFALDWRELPGRKASRIIVRHEGDFLADGESERLVEWLVDAADRLAWVFPKRL